MTDQDIKNFSLSSFQVKELGDGSDKNDKYVSITAIASTFGNIDRTGDVIGVGAFDESISELRTGQRSIKILYQHNMSEPLGIVDKLEVVGDNLLMEGRMVRSLGKVQDILALGELGALSDVSIGFKLLESRFDGDERIIEKVELFEVSIVTIPANEKARILELKNDKSAEKKPDEKLETKEPLKDEKLNKQLEEKMVDEIKEKDCDIVGIIEAENITTKRDFEKVLRKSGGFTRKAAEVMAKFFIEEDQGEPEPSIEKQGEPVDEVKLDPSLLKEMLEKFN